MDQLRLPDFNEIHELVDRPPQLADLAGSNFRSVDVHDRLGHHLPLSGVVGTNQAPACMKEAASSASEHANVRSNEWQGSAQNRSECRQRHSAADGREPEASGEDPGAGGTDAASVDVTARRPRSSRDRSR